MTDKSRGEHFAIQEKTKVAEGAAAGGVTGGVIGAIVAGLTAVAALSIPGLGILAAGPLVAALAGGGAGAATGGLIGALAGLGIKEHEAKLYDEEVRRGSRWKSRGFALESSAPHENRSDRRLARNGRLRADGAHERGA